MSWMSKELEIDFHGELPYKPGHPAINVKWYGASLVDFSQVSEDRAQEIYELCLELWWAEANEIAEKCGYSGVFSEGRSSGWLVPYYASGERSVRYPDVRQLGERSRFLSFRRKILKLKEEFPRFLQMKLKDYSEKKKEVAPTTKGGK